MSAEVPNSNLVSANPEVTSIQASAASTAEISSAKIPEKDGAALSPSAETVGDNNPTQSGSGSDISLGFLIFSAVSAAILAIPMMVAWLCGTRSNDDKQLSRANDHDSPQHSNNGNSNGYDSTERSAIYTTPLSAAEEEQKKLEDYNRNSYKGGGSEEQQSYKDALWNKYTTHENRRDDGFGYDDDTYSTSRSDFFHKELELGNILLDPKTGKEIYQWERPDFADLSAEQKKEIGKQYEYESKLWGEEGDHDRRRDREVYHGEDKPTSKPESGELPPATKRSDFYYEQVGLGNIVEGKNGEITYPWNNPACTKDHPWEQISPQEEKNKDAAQNAAIEVDRAKYQSKLWNPSDGTRSSFYHQEVGKGNILVDKETGEITYPWEKSEKSQSTAKDTEVPNQEKEVSNPQGMSKDNSTEDKENPRGVNKNNVIDENASKHTPKAGGTLTKDNVLSAGDAGVSQAATKNLEQQKQAGQGQG